MKRPILKSFARTTRPGEITLIRELGVEFALADPDGQLGALLDALDGTRTIADLIADMHRCWPSLTPDAIGDAVSALDAAGLLEDAAAQTSLTPRQQVRYSSNMAFFSTFAHLGYSRFDYQESLSRSRVVLLGVGGVGSSLLYNLAGLGVGHVVALDCDAVELKNLSRQFLYAEADVGQSKIECASARALALNSEMAITSFERRVTGPDDISDVLAGADLVLAVIDQPVEVREWINTACVAARVPYITGGVTVSRGVYWSVDPGTSGCLACRQAQQHPDQAITFPTQVNRAIGPAAGLVGSLIALEAVRYLTGFAAPISAGRMWLADLVTGQTDVGYTWERRPDCPICGIEAMQRNDAVDVAAIASVAR